ncbi:MAG: DUF2889 domain-containing protein [Myxococcales bacterium]|nr:DUF2889 domain-containing protein [Myxococcales bacterium]
MEFTAHGHPLHTRSLTLVVTKREDGRWRARGDVIDLRKSSFVPMQDDLQPSGIVHQMSIEASVDPASRRLEALQTEQPFVAIEPSETSGGECCRDPAPRLQALVGDTLDAGFAKRLNGVFGGRLGCSHLLTLFRLMASGLVRAFELESALSLESRRARRPGERLFRRAAFVDGFQRPDESLELAVQLSDLHTRPAAEVELPLERLADQFEVRLLAKVQQPAFAISELRAAVRRRSARTFSDAEWQDASARLGELEGSSLGAGFARTLFEVVGRDPVDAPLLDALLQIAPGHIQVLAAISERWLHAIASGAGAAALRSDGDAPAVAALGGMPDSCYMWRSDGPLHAIRSTPPRPRRSQP